MDSQHYLLCFGGDQMLRLVRSQTERQVSHPIPADEEHF